MKLKNSYILLIIMALFLLVSIGSVCAVDNSTADDGILADESPSVTPNEDTVEKINTTVESGDVKVSEKDPVDINVAVKDNESNTLTVGKENFTVKEGDKAINFTYNDSKISISDKLSIGNHSLSINYLGNDIYKNSTTNIILSIFGDKTIIVPSSVGSDGVNVEIPITITDGVDQYAAVKDNLKLNVTYNGTSKLIEDFTVDNNIIKFVFDINYIGSTVNVNYTEAKESKNVIIKYATVINATDLTLREEDNKTIAVSVVSNGNILNITDKDLKILENGKELKFKYDIDNGTVTITDALARGKHNLTIKYIGNASYNETFKDIVLSIYGNNTIVTNVTAININSTKKGEGIQVNVTNGVNNTEITKDDITLNVTVKNGNNTTVINVKSFDIVNGTLVFELENGNFTTANLTITYNNTLSKTITLNRIYNINITALVLENQYRNGAFKFKLVDVDDPTVSLEGKTLSLYTTGNIRAGFSAKANNESVVEFLTKNLYEFDQSGSITMKELEVGNHLVELSTSGEIKSTALKVNLTIIKADIVIKIADFKEEYGTDKNVTITVTNKKDGEPVSGIILHLYMPQTSGKDYYFQTDSNGQSKISVKNLVGGDYDITVNNNDTKNINPAKTSGKITIVPKQVVINTKSVTVWYNTGTTATIKITDKKTGKVVANAIVLVQLYTGKKYKAYLFQTNNKGVISFSASLSVGKHKMVVQTADTRYKASTVTKYITVKKASAKIKANKVKTYYKGGKYLTVSLTNSKTKKPIYDAKVNIKIYISKNKYYNYNGRTGANGKVKLAVDTLKPGKYKVVISKGESKNYTAKKITTKIIIKKAPTKLIPKKLTAKKGAKKYFKVTVKNKKTKKVIKGVKVKIKVYTGKKYKIYTKKTNSKGIAKLNVKSLKVGYHKVVVSSGNKYCVAKAVKSKIKIKK